MDRTAIKIGVGFLIGLTAAYLIYGLPEKEREAEEEPDETLATHETPKKRKIIPFPSWRLARHRLP